MEMMLSLLLHTSGKLFWCFCEDQLDTCVRMKSCVMLLVLLLLLLLLLPLLLPNQAGSATEAAGESRVHVLVSSSGWASGCRPW